MHITRTPFLLDSIVVELQATGSETRGVKKFTYII